MTPTPEEWSYQYLGQWHYVLGYSITLMSHNWPIMLALVMVFCCGVKLYRTPERLTVCWLFAWLLFGLAYEYQKHVAGQLHEAVDFLLGLELAYLNGLAHMVVGPVITTILYGASAVFACQALWMQRSRLAPWATGALGLIGITVMLNSTQPALAPAQPMFWGLSQLAWRRMALAGIALLVLVLAFVNLEAAPRTWFDEGSHLHVPKTLVQYGVYADISAEGFRYFGPTVGVGPTVMLPIAANFLMSGIGLVQGRLVIVVYLLVALVACYALARRLHGGGVALVALLLVLASRTYGHEGMLEYGRQVLGEVPGVAFLALGLLAWTQAISVRQQAWRYSLLAGIGFGLALVTKNQFVLIVPATLALLALLDWFYYRAGSWWLRIAPLTIACAFFGAWTLIQLQFLGPDGFMANLARTRQAAGGAIFVFEGAATMRAADYLVQVFGGLLIPALLYRLWRCRERTPTAFAELAVVLLPLLWICWYMVSLGWPRYAFPAVVLGAFSVARLAADLWGYLRKNQRPLLANLGATYLALVIAFPLALTTRVVLTPDYSPQWMAAYLNQHVPTATIVETWEPELGLLTDHRYHYPPTELLDTAVRQTWLGGKPLAYDGLAARPEYVVVGPFGAWVNIYNQETLQRDYQIIYRVGPYVLHQRTAGQ
ncbi:MAG: glycosyltransferase family 39 protein [Chloroflexaceae bacterium]|jgi:hypothetical protein|nr:glycosyltransferase family 39 protein [Chloroflexaceae bacterium]